MTRTAEPGVDALTTSVATLEATLASERVVLANTRAELASSQAQVAELTRERDVLRASHERLELERYLTRTRGTMCRWLEDLGATLGATVVHAARDEAMKTAFCISTDATGIAVQPLRSENRRRQPRRRGHYFVLIADRDHIFFEYTPKETGAAAGEMFKGFSGYVQANAKNVFDILFRPPEDPPPGDGEFDLAVCQEVGCWSHARRKFWEATVAKSAVAREELARIGRLFALERRWKERTPAQGA